MVFQDSSSDDFLGCCLSDGPFLAVTPGRPTLGHTVHDEKTPACSTSYQGADYLGERGKRLVIVGCLGEYVAMNEEQFDGMRVIDVQTGALRYRVRGSRMVDVQTGQVAFRIRSNERVVDVMSGQLVFRIRGGERLVDVNSGALRFRLRG